MNKYSNMNLSSYSPFEFFIRMYYHLWNDFPFCSFQPPFT